MTSPVEYSERHIHPTVAEQYFRNGKPAHGKQIRSLMRALNTLQARSRVIIPPMVWAGSSALSHTGDGCIARAVYPSSCNGTRLGVRFVLYPSSDDTKSPSWYMKIDGSNATPIGKTSHLFTHTNYASGWSRDSCFIVDAEYSVSASAIHEVELWRADETTFHSWSLYEVEAPYLSGLEDFVNSSKIAAGMPITDDNHEEACNLIRSIYDRQQGVALNVNEITGGDPVTVTDAVTDLLRTAGGWNDGAASYSFAPVGILAPCTDTYLYRAWVYGNLDPGGDLTNVSFVFQNGGAETITVSLTSETPGYVYSDYTPIQETVGEAHEINVTAISTSGLTASVYAFGLMKLSYSTAP